MTIVSFQWHKTFSIGKEKYFHSIVEKNACAAEATQALTKPV
jgi:hypothetical protein